MKELSYALNVLNEIDHNVINWLHNFDLPMHYQWKLIFLMISNKIN